MKSLLLLACSTLALVVTGAALADPQTDEANRQRQMASMQAEAARADRASADRSLAQQQSTADAARAANNSSGSSSSSSSGSSSGSAATSGDVDTGPQSVVDSYTIVIRTQETPQQMLARLAQQAAAGDTGAQYNLGRIYYTGFNDAPRDDARARDYFRRAAMAGHAPSQANYGYFLTEGVGGARDPSEGQRWLKTAADAGNSFGQAQYGMSLVTTNAPEAVRYLIPAADAGEITAQGMMGTLYAMGEGVAQDDPRAVHYLRAASDQGEIHSTGLLAGMYISHRGGSEAEGYDLLRQAAEAGDPLSQMNYGLLQLQGNVVPKDMEAGAALVRLAAYSGSNPARMMLGDLYNEGEGVPEEGIDAIYWWNLAAEDGFEDGVAVMAEVRAGGNAVGRPPTQGTGPVAVGGAASGPRRGADATHATAPSAPTHAPTSAPSSPPAPAAARTIEGELANSDAKLGDDSFFDCYPVQTSAGAPYRATMRSDAFDTYLSVGTGECSGTATLSDDDGGGGTNSAVSFTGDGQVWFVRANSLSANTTGAYVVEIGETERPPALTPGRTVQGDLATSDAKLPDNSFYDCFSVQTSAGAQYRVTMRSAAFDTYLGAGSGQCSGSPSVSDDDGGGGTDSALAFTGDGQVWFVRANSLGANATGAYAVELTEGASGAGGKR